MSGKIARRLAAAVVLLAVSLTTEEVARQATKGAGHRRSRADQRD